MFSANKKTRQPARTPSSVGAGFRFLMLAGAAAVYCSVIMNMRTMVLAAAILAVLLLGMFIPMLHVRAVRARLRVSRRRGQVGAPLRTVLSLANRLPWPAKGFTAQLHASDVHGNSYPSGAGERETADAPAQLQFRRFIDHLAPWRTTEVVWNVVPTRRGVFPTAPPWLLTGFPFGIWRGRRSIEFGRQDQVLIWPEMFPVEDMAVDGGAGEGESTDAFRTGVVGEFLGVRPWRPGESVRRVHWPQTARHDRLIVCEHSAHQSQRIHIVIETDANVHDRPDANRYSATLERAFSTGASFARHFCNQGLVVSLVFERKRLWRAQSREGMIPLLDAMARFDERLQGSLAELLAHRESREYRHTRQIIVTTAAGLERLDEPARRHPHRYYWVVDDHQPFQKHWRQLKHWQEMVAEDQPHEY